jgi:hypothetical protein
MMELQKFWVANLPEKPQIWSQVMVYHILSPLVGNGGDIPHFQRHQNLSSQGLVAMYLHERVILE